LTCRGRIVRKVEVSESVLLAGFPGVGFAAPLAVYHIESVLGCEGVAEIFCPSLGGVLTDGEGGLLTQAVKVKLAESVEPGILTVWTVSQPESTREAYDLCDELIRVSKEFGCRLIVSMTSISGVERGRVYCAASSRKTLSRGLDAGLEAYEGEIGGLSGLLTALCRLRDVEGICLLAGSSDVVADLEASDGLVRAAGRVVGVEFSPRGLEESAEEFVRVFKIYGG